MNLPKNNIYTIGEAAKLLGVSISTLRRWEREGKVSIGRTPGGKRAFTNEDLELLKSPIRTEVVKTQAPTRTFSAFSISPTKVLVFMLFLASVATNAIFFSYTPLPRMLNENFKLRVADYLKPVFDDYLKENYLVVQDKFSNVLGDKEVFQSIGGEYSSLSILSPTNQIINSSFEGGIAGFSIIGQSTNTNTKVGIESVRSGTQALKIEDLFCINCQLGISQPSISTINGRDYALSVYIRVKDLKGDPKLRLGLFGTVSTSDPIYLSAFSKGELLSSYYLNYSRDQYEDFSLSSLPQNEWIRLEVTFTTLPLGKYPIIETIGYQGGTIYIDDLQFLEGVSEQELFSESQNLLSSSSIYPAEKNNSKLADNTVIGDSFGNIYPTSGFTGSLGTDTLRFGSLYTSKLTVDSSGNLNTSGNLSAKDLTLSGTLSVGGGGGLTMTSFLAGDGTATAPSFAFSSDTDTGFFRATTDTLGISTAGTERLRINSSGNVGIGTTGPTGNLQINGGGVQEQGSFGSSTPQLRIIGTSSNDAIIHFGTTSNGRRIYLDESDSNKLKFTGGGATDQVTIDNDGNVGIGTTGPGNQLHIFNSATSGSVQKISTSDTATGVLSGVMSLELENRDTTVNNQSQLVFSSKDTGGSTIAGANIAAVFTSHAVADGATDLRFSTRPSGVAMTEKMRITSAGKVGINTTDLSGNNQLRVVQSTAGTIAAGKFENGANSVVNLAIGNGNGMSINCEESNNIYCFQAGVGTSNITTMWGGGGWSIGNAATNQGAGTINVTGNIYKNGSAYNNPDYVFEHYFSGQIVKFKDREGANGYAGLLPLLDVEEFAKQNYQLSRVADKRGIFDRTDVLLEKVEELFLYGFDHEKRIKSIEENSLESQIASLSARIDLLESISSTSGVLGDTEASSSASFNDLTIFNKLITTDLGVTGNISSGILVIKGIDGDHTSINTLSNDLYLQSAGIGGINILGGKVLIDKDGNIKTEGEINANKLSVNGANPGSASAGTATLPAGNASVLIQTTAVTEDSKIFITPKSNTGKQPLIVDNENPGVGFDVRVEEVYTSDIAFNWWILDVK